MSSDNAKNILWFVTGPLALIAIGLITLSIMRYVQKPEKVIKKFEWLRTFYVWLGALAILGGTWAFFLPIALNSGFNKDDDGPVLRQLLIYTVGGLLGVVTLGETHRKNNHEKDKNDQDHTRQVHTERRSRYTKAIEHLFNENISIRLGGVYTLAGLADEWLSDEKTLPNEKERRKETQNIINNLCTYIHSPFPLAEHAEQLDKPYAKDLQKDFSGYTEKFEEDKQIFTRDKAALKEERQVRSTILQKIHERLQSGSKSGPWSDFEYNFSNAKFFYPVNFESSHFCTFLDFSGATFTEKADFSKVTFTREIGFSGVTFAKTASFSAAIFIQITVFSGAEFTQDADFSGAAFTRNANFSGAEFTGYTHFTEATFQTEPIFESALGNEARFSCKVEPENYNFEVSSESPYKIETWDPERNGIKFTIPKGAILFDPDEPSEQEDNDDN